MDKPPDESVSDAGHEIIFQSPYGGLPKFFWYFVLPIALLASGFLFVRPTWFDPGIRVDGVRLSPQVVAWVVCPIIWLVCALIIGVAIYRRMHPQRIVLTAGGLQLPKGRFTDQTVHIRWPDLKATLYSGHVSFMDFYEVTCMDCRHGKKTRIASSLFWDFDDFATFALILGEHMGEDWSIKGFLPGTIRGRRK